MSVFSVWCVVCVLCYVGASVCVKGDEYEVNYSDSYDNEITERQEGEHPATPYQAAEFSRWDKLFIALEDSHMRQNMLLESLEQCCGGMASVRAQVDGLAKGSCQQCVPSLESVCRGHVEQASLRLQRGLAELREEGVKRERRVNATLHQLLHSSHEQNTRLKRLEEVAVQRGEVTGGGGTVGAGHGGGTGPMTPRPGGLGAGLGLGTKPFPSGLKEQEVTTPLDMATMERALVTIATELQKVQVQLSRLMEHGMNEGGQRKGRRDAEGRVERRRDG